MVKFASLVHLFSVFTAFSSVILTIIGLKIKSQDKKIFYLYLGERLVQFHFITLLLTTLCLIYLLVEPNFSVEYVAKNVNANLPFFYKITALWAGQSGSLLFWNLLVSLFSLIAISQLWKKEPSLAPYVTIIALLSSAFFCILGNFSEDSNPFLYLSQNEAPFYPPEGRGLNPLLQHWAMVIHPPILYLGYVSFIIPYAFAMGSLLKNSNNVRWLKLARKWILFSWYFLGVGILLGGKWAYEELGWGGYWAWDPVENAALLPWLTSTAFLHSVIVQEQRNMLKTWNMVLVSLSYLMCIFGTFLTRSGVVTSVHSFAKSDLGNYFLIYMAITALFSLILILLRLPLLKSDKKINSLLSREVGFLLNNILLIIMLFIVIWGTLYPSFSEFFYNERVSVDATWFNTWMVPLSILILFLTGVGPLLSWRKTKLTTLYKNFLTAIIGAFIIFFYFILNKPLVEINQGEIYAGIICSLAVFIIIGIIEELHRFFKQYLLSFSEPTTIFKRVTLFFQMLIQNKRRFIGYLVHLSLAILFVGFSGKAFEKDIKVLLKEKESIEFQGYIIELQKIEVKQLPLYVTYKSNINVYYKNKYIGSDITELRSYPMFNIQNKTYDDFQNTSEPAIINHFPHDIYVQYGGAENESTFIFQIWYNPFVNIVWIGFYLFIVLGLILLIPYPKKKF